MEWQTASPPPWDNFEETPQVTEPYDFDHLKYDEEAEGYVTA